MEHLNHEYWNKHIYSTGKGFEECVREETTHLATLKVLTDHLNWEARVGSFDPEWQTGGSATFFYFILKEHHHKISKKTFI